MNSVRRQLLPEIRQADALRQSQQGSNPMTMASIRCPVLGAHITRVTDFEGGVTKIICGEYDKSTGRCRLKRSALQGGPLAQLLERVSEEALNTRSTLCVLSER